MASVASVFPSGIAPKSRILTSSALAKLIIKQNAKSIKYFIDRFPLIYSRDIYNRTHCKSIITGSSRGLQPDSVRDASRTGERETARTHRDRHSSGTVTVQLKWTPQGPGE